jgi:hypothetical protein
VSDAHDPDPTPSTHQVEIEVDLGAFLPETTAIGPDESLDEPLGEDGGDTVVESARPGAAAEVEPHAPDAPASEVPDDAPVTGQESAQAPPVDLAVLAGIEADLAAVDQAIEAIDAGDHARSPLLAELLDPQA